MSSGRANRRFRGGDPVGRTCRCRDPERGRARWTSRTVIDRARKSSHTGRSIRSEQPSKRGARRDSRAPGQRRWRSSSTGTTRTRTACSPTSASATPLKRRSSSPKHRTRHDAPFIEKLGKLNAQHNDGIPRIALKLATGTGKTLVMAMLMLWQAKNGYCRDFVIFVPNLTIRARLAEIRGGSPLYEQLRPKGDRTRLRVTVINFQAWQPRSGVGIEGSMTKEQMRAMGLDAERYKDATTESEDEMIDRLLAAHRGHGHLCVLNDEAHHCYNGERAGGSRIEGESNKEETRGDDVVRSDPGAAATEPAYAKSSTCPRHRCGCESQRSANHRCSSPGQ